jgi:hypothetical protein
VSDDVPSRALRSFDSDKIIAGILKNKRQSDPTYQSISEDEGGHSGGVGCELRVRLDGEGRIYTTT